MPYIPYPLIFSFSIMVGYLTYQKFEIGTALVLTVSFSFLLVLLFEIFLPEKKTWRPKKIEIFLDIFHGLISNTFPNLIFKMLFYSFCIRFNQQIESYLSFELWPHSLPLVIQLFLGLLFAEIGFYSFHRFFHNSKLWPLHALHHSIERMYFLAGSRTHPLQVFVTYGAQMLILWFLGAPSFVIYFHALFTSVNGLLQHANIKMNFGFLNLIFATPELHRWHHSQIVKESNNNYGTNLILWDLIFKTYYLPRDRKMPDKLGLMPEDIIPLKLKEHLISPFKNFMPPQ